MRGGPVVVGVSPTTGSPKAIRWAADEARLRGAPLVAVMAWRPPRPPAAPGGRPSSVSTGSAGDDHAKVAEENLRGFVAVALGAVGDVECRALRGTAVTSLLAAARDAQLLVVGEPRSGAMGSVRSSLVAPKVVLKADCPVVVMPAEAVETGDAAAAGTA
jgi:nucleotide-binding universal stress UspA family protein